MKCTQCGRDVPAGASFCPQCGAQLRKGSDVGGGEPTAAVRMRPGGAQGAIRDLHEQELWSGGYSPKAMTGHFIGAALLAIIGMIGASFAGPAGWAAVGVGAVVVFGYLGLLLVYRRMSIRYRLTSQRLLRDTGILTRTGDHLLVVNIDDVTVRQGLIERMFNVGTIVLNTKDKTTQQESEGVLTMLGIETPRAVADMIDGVRRAERSRRALYTMDA